jgi:ABC-2 type transport system permease protein
MNKYLSFFRLRFIMGLQYRAAALAGIVTQFIWGFMEILVFRAFYTANKAAFPMTFTAMTSYIWLQQAFLAFFMAWFMEEEIFDAIINGNIAYELCRPIGIYEMWFSRSVSNRLSRAVLRCSPILIVAVYLPRAYRLSAPKGWLEFVMFIVTMLLGLLVTVAFCMLIYILSFFTISPQGLRILFLSCSEFFSGGVIPLPFFPDRIRAVMELQPFASMQNVPLRIYSGDITGDQMIKAVLMQIFWLCVLIGVGKQICRSVEKKIAVQGG